MSPNDPQFVGTLDRILRTPEKGGLRSAGFVFRYDHEQTDDGKPTSFLPASITSLTPSQVSAAGKAPS